MADQHIHSDVLTSEKAVNLNVVAPPKEKKSSASGVIHASNSYPNTITTPPIIASDSSSTSPPLDKQTFEQWKQQPLQTTSSKLQHSSSNATVNSDRVIMEDVADVEKDVVGVELIEWLENQGADTKKLMLQQYAPEVRGVHCRNELVPGERILFIPKNCLITVEMGKQTEIGQKVLAHNIEFVAPKHIFLMLYLLTDMEKVKHMRLRNCSSFFVTFLCMFNQDGPNIFQILL